MADKKISQLTTATTPIAGAEVFPIVQNNSTVKVALTEIGQQKPSNWFVNSRVFNIGPNAYLEGRSNYPNYYSLTSNVFLNTAGDFSYISDSYATRYLQIDGEHRLFTAPAGTAGNTATFTQVLNVDTNGNTTLNTGNLVIGTSGKGIDFSATASGSGTMTSELLADYEEGTFTPVVFGASTAGTGTYVNQIGYYTKIGRQVTIQIYLEWSAHTGTGTMQVSGLPYTSQSGYSASLSVVAYNMTTAANSSLGARVLSANSVLELLQLPTGGGAWGGVIMDTAVDALVITGTYFV